MKKVVAFLLVLLIFAAPVTTLVKADVVIGDNDEIIMNENATILGRKLAMLESLSDLALSGVTEFTISNTDDVDTYLDSLWTEINDAIDYLESYDWVGDIPDDIASKYYTNLVNYRNVVNNRGEFLGFDLQNPATSLLKTYFANDTYGRKYTSTNLYQSLDMVRALSNLTRNTPSPTPEPGPDFSFIRNINSLFARDFDGGSNVDFFYPTTYYTDNNATNFVNFVSGHSRNYTFFANYNFGTNHINDSTIGNSLTFFASSIVTIYVTELENNVVSVEYTNLNPITLPNLWNPPVANNNFTRTGFIYHSSHNGFKIDWYSNDYTPTITTFTGLSSAINYIYQHYANINLYVNGDLWASVPNIINNPTIDIDGYLKIYGNDNPNQYELQPNTQIDYDQLYQVIYNAIRDNLPISQGDINYYDSHDTIYSPTIINNYGEENGEESDLIDTILDYAVIPKFDTSIAQPMRKALTNGVVIMNTSITDVIPNDILLILGACFFLLLFAVIINRMIK